MGLWESDPTAHISIRPAVCLFRSSAGEAGRAGKGDRRKEAGGGEEKEVGGRQKVTGKVSLQLGPVALTHPCRD